jgi:hypothetical protein
VARERILEAKRLLAAKSAFQGEMRTDDYWKSRIEALQESLFKRQKEENERLIALLTERNERRGTALEAPEFKKEKV